MTDVTIINQTYNPAIKHAEAEMQTKDLSYDKQKNQDVFESHILNPLPVAPGPVEMFCAFISDAFKQMTEIFNPFIGFVNAVDNEKNKLSNEEIAQKMQEQIKDINEKIKADEKLKSQLSPESLKALENLTKVLSDESLKNVNLGKLIQTWRQNGNTQALFRMAEMIRNRQCLQTTPLELRKMFVKGLESLATAIEEAKSHPQSPERDEAVQHLAGAADHVVNGVERAEKANEKGNLSNEDRQYIGNELSCARDKTNTVLQNPSLSRFVQNSFSRLFDWVNEVTDFLKDWFKETKEAEKKEEKKKCVERHRKLKKMDELCRRHKTFQRRANEFLALMREAQRKMLLFLRLREAEKDKLNLVRYPTDRGVKRYSAIYDYSGDKYSSHIAASDYYKGKEERIETSLPPSYVCSLINLNLDILC